MMNLFERFLSYMGYAKEVDQKPSQALGFSADDRARAELKASSALYNLLENGRGIISQLFGQAISDKRQVIDMVDAYKETFFHSAIVDLLIDDIISVDPSTNNIVEITSDNDTIKEMLDNLQDRVDIDNFISAIIDDLISYGEVVSAVKNDGKHVTELLPLQDQRDTVVVYKGNTPKFLVQQNKSQGNFEVNEYINFIHFCIPGKKIKVKLDKEFIKSMGQEEGINEYFRLGKPLFWGTWDLLNSLYMLLIFYPVFAVQKLNATTVIGVKVPKEMPPAKAYEVARKYMELLNVSMGVDQMGRVSVADVIDTIGKYKVIPVYGEEEKGFMQLNDPRLEESYALDVVDELKKTLCASIGVPYEFLFGASEGAGKLATLKSFNRYVKKISRIQLAIAQGLTNLAIIEGKLQGLKIMPSAIEVRFRNSIISVEQLDKLEFLSGMIDTVEKSVETVANIAKNINADIDTEKLIDFVNSYLGLSGLDGTIKKPKQDVINPAEDVEQDTKEGAFVEEPPFEDNPAFDEEEGGSEGMGVGSYRGNGGVSFGGNANHPKANTEPGLAGGVTNAGGEE